MENEESRRVDPCNLVYGLYILAVLYSTCLRIFLLVHRV